MSPFPFLGTGGANGDRILLGKRIGDDREMGGGYGAAEHALPMSIQVPVGIESRDTGIVSCMVCDHGRCDGVCQRHLFRVPFARLVRGDGRQP